MLTKTRFGLRSATLRRVDRALGGGGLISLLTAVVLAAQCLVVSPATSLAEDPPSAVGPILGLLKSGRLPADRVGKVVELVCQRGNKHDLAFVLGLVADSEKLPATARLATLEGLADAARTRKVIPDGDLSALNSLLEASQSKEIRTQAIELAGLWNVKAAAPALAALATEDAAARELRTAAIDSLVKLDRKTARTAIDTMTGAKQPPAIRFAGVRALASLDIDAAAEQAALVLSQTPTGTNPAALLTPFFSRQGATDLLATAVQKTPPSADMAKLALRHMYASGRNDQSLGAALSKAAGFSATETKLTKQQIADLAERVQKEGDPARGEQIFRRADLSCMKCHAVSKAGGQVGPDLSAVGQASPVDYLLNSVLDPSQAIKEAYLTRVILTEDGEQFQGIVADRDDDRIILKDATGKTTTIAAIDILAEKEGKSLMPAGLTKFLTIDELVDLTAFLSALGKPGEYAVRTTATMQRWRMLISASDAVNAAVPDDDTFQEQVLKAKGWLPVYSRVNGELPLTEVIAAAETAAATDKQAGVVFVQGLFNVAKSGPISLQFNDATGVEAWIDGEHVESLQDAVTPGDGIHSVTLRVDRAVRKVDTIKLTLTKPAGSDAEFAVVDGQ